MSSTKQIQITLNIPSNFELAEPVPRPPRKGEWYLDWDEQDVTVCQATSTKDQCFCFPILRPVKPNAQNYHGDKWTNVFGSPGIGKTMFMTTSQDVNDFMNHYFRGPLPLTGPEPPEGFEIIATRPAKPGDWYLHRTRPKQARNPTLHDYPILRPTMEIPYGFKLAEGTKRHIRKGEWALDDKKAYQNKEKGYTTLVKYWVLELNPPTPPEGWEFAEEAPRIPNEGDWYISKDGYLLERHAGPPATEPRFIVRKTWTPPASCPKGTVFTKYETGWCFQPPAKGCFYTAERFFTDFTPPPTSPYTV